MSFKSPPALEIKLTREELEKRLRGKVDEKYLQRATKSMLESWYRQVDRKLGSI